MKLPWTDKTGLAKATTVLSTILLISLGLCGVNFVAVLRFATLGGPNAAPIWPDTFLTIAAAIELIAIFGSVCGLIIVVLLSSGRLIRLRLKPNQEDQTGKGTTPEDQ